MKMSDKKRKELYAAIRAPLLDIRVRNQQGRVPHDAVDEELRRVENVIWRSVATVLKLERPI